MAFHPCTVHYSDHPPPSALRAARRANVSVLRSSEDNRPCGPFIHRVHRSARPYIAFANRRQRLCVYVKKTIVGRPPSRAMDTNGEARCLQFERLLDPRMLHSSCPGRTARTKSPARVDQLPGRRPLLLCPAAFEVSPSLTAGLGLDPTLGRLMCVERTASPVPPRYEVFLARFGHPSSGSGSTWS